MKRVLFLVVLFLGCSGGAPTNQAQCALDCFTEAVKGMSNRDAILMATTVCENVCRPQDSEKTALQNQINALRAELQKAKAPTETDPAPVTPTVPAK